jgi:hypothetical protein
MQPLVAHALMRSLQYAFASGEDCCWQSICSKQYQLLQLRFNTGTSGFAAIPAAAVRTAGATATMPAKHFFLEASAC